jgi:hypothetical protein
MCARSESCRASFFGGVLVSTRGRKVVSAIVGVQKSEEVAGQFPVNSLFRPRNSLIFP